MNDHQKQALTRLFGHYFGEVVKGFEAMPRSGSNRSYFRIYSENHRAIGVCNSDDRENKAFVYMTRFFRDERMPVPELLGEDLDHDVYLVEDLGDRTLFDLIKDNLAKPGGVEMIRPWLKLVIRELARMQVMAGKKMDFSYCYPYKRFNKDSVTFDLHYFREQFLDQQGISYDSKALDRDFDRFADMILEPEQEFFMYRDFQSRNIMVNNNRVCFIDYQGGRLGPLQYDLASFLYQARAGLPESLREEMLEDYIRVVRLLTPVDVDEFKHYFYPVALHRVFKTLVASSLRGLREKKEHFIRSIPYALENLYVLVAKNPVMTRWPELNKILNRCSR